jgi:hypothetical protein
VSHFDTVGFDQESINSDGESGDGHEDKEKLALDLSTPRRLA